MARRIATGDSMVWCNSDLIINRNPFDVPEEEIVYGFHRREVPSGDTGKGIDMYKIPFGWWDKYLSRDIPKLYLGASYVDRWISRAMEQKNAYRRDILIILHIPYLNRQEVMMILTIKKTFDLTINGQSEMVSTEFRRLRF
jgi:hypothetical protein